MKITIESTSWITHIVKNDVEIPARLWEGQTESGIPVQVLVTRIAAPTTENLSQFDKELKEQRAPQAGLMAFPLRLIL